MFDIIIDIFRNGFLGDPVANGSSERTIGSVCTAIEVTIGGGSVWMEMTLLGGGSVCVVWLTGLGGGGGAGGRNIEGISCDVMCDKFAMSIPFVSFNPFLPSSNLDAYADRS